MRSHQDIDIFEVPENSTPTYRTTLVDDLGTVIPGALITTLTLTVVQEYTLEVVNDRDDQDVLNDNDVTFTNGVIVWTLQPEDTVILNNALRKEMHRALFAWTYDSGAKSGNKEVIIMITNRVGI